MYNKLNTASCTRKTECSCLWSPSGNVFHSKLSADDFLRTTDDLINWKVGWLWIGNRVWGWMREQLVLMWCEDDQINLLSLQSAFIPNGSDMSRAQYYLPSHCAGSRRAHGKKEQEGERDRQSNMWESKTATERDRGRKSWWESGSNQHPKNIRAFSITNGLQSRSWKTLLIRTARNQVTSQHNDSENSHQELQDISQCTRVDWVEIQKDRQTYWRRLF